MGHIGLTPQSALAMGGFKIQARQVEQAQRLIDDAKALEGAGVFSIVLEGVPSPVARAVTAQVSVPTIGIGAGVGCDGQVLVFHDVLGIEDRIRPRFVRRYAELGALSVDALAQYAADVRSQRFPTEDESYKASDELTEALSIY
jgi:3-methyl-2-oxobutanoate hydroxymethyltransferase